MMTVNLSSKKSIHFLGIGGSGMSPLAGAILAKGWLVSGTDIMSSSITDMLTKKGAKIFFSHHLSNLDGAQVVVVSTAISEDNIEYIYAKKQGLLILRRVEMLDYLMNDAAHRIAVAGTHGKTTSSGFMATVLESMGCKPSFIIGSMVNNLQSSFAIQKSDYFVAEADESDGSFLSLHPNFGILTNIEEEHMNYFKTVENLKHHFSQFILGVIDRKGVVAVNGDDGLCLELSKPFDSERVKTFGLKKGCDYQARKLMFSASGVSFDVYQGTQYLGLIRICQFGTHNVYNALGCLVIGLSLGFSFEEIKKGLALFEGTKRRMQPRGEAKGVHVYDDYGHHPTEIKTTLSGVKSCLDKRLICIFQPHRYTRTRDFLGDFATSFLAADLVVICDVYAAGETPISGIHSGILAQLVQSNIKGDVLFIPNKEDIVTILRPKLQPGDVVITMGAGDIWKIGPKLVTALQDT